MNCSTLNPYRRNTEIMRSFFRKPVTLITGLVLFLSFMTRIISNTFNSEYAFVTLDILFGIGFLLLFSTARSKSENPSFGVQALLIKISAIISCCVCVTATIAVILFAVLLYFVASAPYTSVYADLFPALVLFGSLLLICIIPMIFYIHLARLSGSFKKSVKSVYLYRKGALGVGIFGILYALITLLSFFILPALKELSGVFVFLIQHFFEANDTSAMIIGLQFDFSEFAFAEFSYFDFAAVILSFLSKIAVSVLGFKYNGYIKKITEHLTPSHTKSDSEPSAEQPVKSDVKEPNPYNQSKTATINPQEFVPQPVFRLGTDRKICPNCHYESDGNMPFCANCGTKLS